MDQQQLIAVAGDFAIAILLGALGRHRAREAQGRGARARPHRGLADLHPAGPARRGRRLSLEESVLALDPGRGASHRRRLHRRRLFRHSAVERWRQGAHHRNRGDRRVPARGYGHVRRARARHCARRGHGCRARLQAAAARLRGEARLGRRLCRLAAADRDLHRAAAPAQPPHRPMGRAQSLQALAARDPDLEPVACRLCADAMARAGEGNGADRIDGRARIVDRGHLVVRARSARQPAKRGVACLRHPACLGCHVPARHRAGGGGQSQAPA